MENPPAQIALGQEDCFSLWVNLMSAKKSLALSDGALIVLSRCLSSETFWSQALAFQPFAKLFTVDVDTTAYLYEGRFQSICFRMENPPPQLAFSCEYSFFSKLPYCPKLGVIDDSSLRS